MTDRFGLIRVENNIYIFRDHLKNAGHGVHGDKQACRDRFEEWCAERLAKENSKLELPHGCAQ